MKPEQQEIARLKREVTKLKAESDILKTPRSLLREGSDMKFVFMAKHRRIWPVAWLCNALGQRSTFASKQTGRFWQRLRLVRFKCHLSETLHVWREERARRAPPGLNLDIPAYRSDLRSRHEYRRAARGRSLSVKMRSFSTNSVMPGICAPNRSVAGP